MPLVVRETTGLAMDARDAPRSRRVLTAAGLKWKETALGKYVLFVVAKPDDEKATARNPAFYWTEQGCFAADMSRFAGL